MQLIIRGILSSEIGLFYGIRELLARADGQHASIDLLRGTADPCHAPGLV
jgi:hypothetical protein